MKVKLWHGTTQSAALRIVEEGMRQTSSADVIRCVAATHKVDAQAIVDWLESHSRYVVIQERRDSSAWFATSPRDAIKWAQRAPEGKWEALWAVWCLLHDAADEWAPWASPAASAWHLSQLLDDSPAIVEVQISVERLQDEYQHPIPSSHHDDTVELVAEGSLPQISVALPLQPELIADYNVIPRHVSIHTAAGFANKSTDELIEMMHSGQLPPLREPLHPLAPWHWNVDELFAAAPSWAPPKV